MMKTVNVKMTKRQLDEYMQFFEQNEQEEDPHYIELKKLYSKHFDQPDYELSENQKKFVRKAKREGYHIRWDYSGRGMFGDKCPAVVAPWGAFSYKGASTDNMGRDMVIYVPH